MNRKRMLVLAATAACLAFGAGLWAAPPADPVAARHEAMEEIGATMKTLGGMARGQTPYDAAVVAAKASAIKAHLEAAARLFPPGSDRPPSEAKPEVWTDKAGFDKSMKDSATAAAALAASRDAASFKAALGALGQTCKSCHDRYRHPDEH